MRQTATVHEVGEDQILAGCRPTGGCRHCSSAFCRSGATTLFSVTNPRGLEVAPGDEVELYLDPGKTIWSGFLALGLPLILFAAGYLLVSRLTDTEGIAVAAGIAGLASGFGISLRAGSRARGSSHPQIVSVSHGSVTRPPSG